jgi:Na+-driven multidrug efflux pump
VAARDVDGARAASPSAGFTDGPVAGHVLRLAGFMGMGFLAMTATQLVEVVYLGIVGTDELAAISYTFPIVLTLNAAARGIGIGASAVIARAVGAGDRDRAALLATHCLVLVFAFSAVCTVLGITGAKALLATLGAEGHVLALADLYMRIWFSAFAFFAVSMVGTNLLRSVGNPPCREW